jgi:hypothetical protein
MPAHCRFNFSVLRALAQHPYCDMPSRILFALHRCD